MGFPLLAGVSRKSFIGRTLARDGKDAGVAERVYGTLAAETGLILKGAHIIRTHDVRFAVKAARVADAMVASGGMKGNTQTDRGSPGCPLRRRLRPGFSATQLQNADRALPSMRTS